MANFNPNQTSWWSNPPSYDRSSNWTNQHNQPPPIAGPYFDHGFGGHRPPHPPTEWRQAEGSFERERQFGPASGFERPSYSGGFDGWRPPGGPINDNHFGRRTEGQAWSQTGWQAQQDPYPRRYAEPYHAYDSLTHAGTGGGDYERQQWYPGHSHDRGHDRGQNYVGGFYQETGYTPSYPHGYNHDSHIPTLEPPQPLIMRWIAADAARQAADTSGANFAGPHRAAESRPPTAHSANRRADSSSGLTYPTPTHRVFPQSILPPPGSSTEPPPDPWATRDFHTQPHGGKARNHRQPEFSGPNQAGQDHHPPHRGEARTRRRLDSSAADQTSRDFTPPFQRSHAPSPKSNPSNPPKDRDAIQYLLPRPEPTAHYLNLSSEQSATLSTPQRLLIILDLNGTLLHRPHRRSPTHFMPRPYLGYFLQYLFAHHEVMIWSSARQKNVDGMVEQIFARGFRDRLTAVWGRESLHLPHHVFEQRVQVYKQLTWVWRSGKVQNSFRPRAWVPLAETSGPDPDAPFVPMPFADGWDQTNTLLLDDSREKAAAEPWNLLEIEEFHNRDDQKTADPLGQVVEYLEVLKRQSNVSAFMRQRPFRFRPGVMFDWASVGCTGERG